MATNHPDPSLGGKTSTYSTEALEPNEKAAFDKVIRPDDSYDADGTYWADLPLGRRLRFVAEKDGEEARAELSWFASMFKADPMTPVMYYLKNAVLPGAGLGLEGYVIYHLSDLGRVPPPYASTNAGFVLGSYVLFSIGNVTPLFQSSFPDCWKTHKVCDKNWIAAASYLEIVGILIGQILVGVLGDW